MGNLEDQFCQTLLGIPSAFIGQALPGEWSNGRDGVGTLLGLSSVPVHQVQRDQYGDEWVVRENPEAGSGYWRLRESGHGQFSRQGRVQS